MALRGDHAAGGGGLRLAPTPQAGRERLRRRQCRVTLAGAPFRPGELPVAVALGLSAELAATANASAAAHRLPVELTLRASIDAARVVGFLVAQMARAQTAIVELLDTAAEHCGETVRPRASYWSTRACCGAASPRASRGSKLMVAPSCRYRSS